MKTRLIIVGGFLGAGKTTLLFETARRLTEKGAKVGLITNDQAAELVDTSFLKYANGIVEEVSGSCFCCNFTGLTDAILKLSEENKCELIIAEPVGSCTDISSTILQPLKEKFNETLTIAPLSVLVDPFRLGDILDGGTSGLHESAAYILRKQLEEADIILISKSDLAEKDSIEKLKRKASEKWPLSKVLTVSSKTGEGFDDWLNEVLTRCDAGTHITDVDYDTYAEGEAVLGWYNASYILSGNEDWNSYLIALMNALSARFKKENAAIGHLKMFIQNTESYTAANLTGSDKAVIIRGKMLNSPNAKITINAMVQMSPGDLENMIDDEIKNVSDGNIKYELLASKCLSPGRPNPTFRYGHVI